MGKNSRAYMAASVAIIAVASASVVQGQESASDLLSLDNSSLRSEIQMRYDAGLAASQDPAIVNADDPRLLWANETKVQCGIALGYLKSSTRDEVSISKCDMAYRLMQRVPKPAPVPTPPPPPPQHCTNPVQGTVYFEFDSDTPPENAMEVVNTVARNFEVCDWQSFAIVGHTDRAGTNSYNEDLSIRRANAIRDLMRARGITRPISVGARGEEVPKVPTPDGERNAQNRRVEITVN